MRKEPDYDLFVIGGGSGGVRAARLAAQLGKRVAVAEESRFGGTCVIRGCVPKKLFVYASKFSEEIQSAAGFGWQLEGARFEWPSLLAAKNQEIARLEGLYTSGLRNSGVDVFHTRAELAGEGRVSLAGGERTLSARHILIATGATPNRLPDMPGSSLCITSEEFFDLAELPTSATIIGGGYIAVELAGILHGLGVETTVVYRGNSLLRGFDEELRDGLGEAMTAKGIQLLLNEEPVAVESLSGSTRILHLKGGRGLKTDMVLLAAGRLPNTSGLGLSRAGVGCTTNGAVMTDDYGATSARGIHAIGDVSNREHLTPVAIHEAICLIDTLFKGEPRAADRETIATAVFSQPEIGSVGYSESDARARFDIVEVYRAAFRPMKSSLSNEGERMIMKLIVDGVSRGVVGAHVLGEGAAEMAQLLAVPLKAGLTKEAFDATMAVHPTAAEELVTMYAPTQTFEKGRKVA